MEVGAAIAAVAMALPERRVSNQQIAARLGVDADWIARRTGTRERPWASADERLSRLAADAGLSAVKQAGIEPHELDPVLVATSTADEITPNAGPLVAGLIGADRAGALDVGAACTGWLSALSLACGQIESGRARHALVVGADFPVALPRRVRSRYRTAVRRRGRRRGRLRDRLRGGTSRSGRAARRPSGVGFDQALAASTSG
jgi:3-oxoacyl-[acyl-carrier-protein] synthase III